MVTPSVGFGFPSTLGRFRGWGAGKADTEGMECPVCLVQDGGCVVFRVSGEPVCKERPRGTRSGHHYTPKRTLDAEAVVRACWPAEVPPFDVPVRLDLLFGFETRRRKDLDNAGKLCADALLKVAYTDDSLIHQLQIRCERGVGAGNGFTLVHLAPLPQESRLWERMTQAAIRWG